MNWNRTAQGIVLLIACAGVACTGLPVDPRATAQVKGSASYRERMAMPVDAVFEATLEDVSKADAKAEVIGRTRIVGPGLPPIAFVIAYDPARIVPGRRYTVRARILFGEKLVFTTGDSYPVLTDGHGDEVELLLRRTAAK